MYTQFLMDLPPVGYSILVGFLIANELVLFQYSYKYEVYYRCCLRLQNFVELSFFSFLLVFYHIFMIIFIMLHYFFLVVFKKGIYANKFSLMFYKSNMH